MATTNLPHRTADMIVPRNSELYKAMDVGDAAVLNAGVGGNHGYAADNFRYVNEEPYVSERPYCVVLSTPDAFSGIPGGDVLHGVLRNIMETRTRSFSGITSQVTTEFAEVTWQGGYTLSVPSGSSRQFGAAQHTFYDLRGEEGSRLINLWQRYLLNDPDILHPKIITLDYAGDLLLDEISMACVYFEPDKMMRDIRHACVSLAMMPKVGPEFAMEYNSDNTAGNLREITLEFTGLYEYDTGPAKAIARAALKRMPLYAPDARDAPAGFKDVSARLKAITDGGLVNEMTREANTVIFPDGYAP